jgi:two-component system sensor kinase FixL
MSWMPPTHGMSRWLWAVAFSLVFVLVDAISFIHPIGQLNITPWNPPAALEVLFLMLFGLIWMPWVYVTLLASDWLVRGSTLLTPQVTLGNALLVVCYALIALTLRRLLRGQPNMSSRTEIAWLSLIVACGSALTGTLYIGLLRAMDILPGVGHGAAWYRFFIGDLLGMMVLLPLAFLLLDERRGQVFRAMFRSTSFWTLLALLLVCLGLIISLPLDERLKYFFPLFFAVGLMAVTHALPGAAVACVLVQLLLVFSASHTPDDLAFLLDVQVVILTLNMTGLVIATVVDERRRAEEQLRDSLQLIAAGELAGALAHELHQPLSALNAYAESALMLADPQTQPPEAHSLLLRTLRQIADETVRASEVVRGLRSFFTAGSSKLEQVDMAQLVQTCVQRLQKLADKREVVLQIDLQASPVVQVDAVQISTALTNLIKNAIEASAPGQRVQIEVSMPQRNQMAVRDQAPALSPTQVQDVFRPFFSQKKHGLGLGLSISRSLVENNGGHLIYENQPHKCFVMNLPLGVHADV